MARDMQVGLAIDFDDDGSVRGVRELEGGLRGVEGAGEGASRGVGLFGAALGALSLGYIFKQMTSLSLSAIQTGAKFETLGIQLKTVTGSAAAAGAAMGWITDFTAKTPYQLDQVSAAFVKLKAFGLDPMDGTMQAIADHTSTMGGEIEVMNSLVLALGKSFTVGKLSMEEMRMMMEKGVPVIDILAGKLGVTNEQILEMSQKGLLGRDAIKLLTDGIGELASGASINLMDSFTGKWSNLQDTIMRVQNQFAQGGLMDAVKDALTVVIDQLEFLESQQYFAKLGEAAGQFVGTLVTHLPRVFELMQNLLENSGKYLSALIDIAKVTAALWVTVKLFAYVSAIGKTVIALTGLASIIKVFASNLAISQAQTLAASVGMNSLTASTNAYAVSLVSTGKKVVAFAVLMGKMQVALVAATVAGIALAKWFDTMNKLPDVKVYHEQIKSQKALAEAINITYGSGAKFYALTGMSIQRAGEYIEELKKENKLRGKWAEIETLRLSLLKTTVSVTEDVTEATEGATDSVSDHQIQLSELDETLKKVNEKLDGTRGLSLNMDRLASQFSLFENSTGTLTDSLNTAYGRAMVLSDGFGELWLQTDTAVSGFSAVANEVESLDSTLAGFIETGLSGDWENFWQPMFESFSSGFETAVTDAVGEGGSIRDIAGNFWEDLQGSTSSGGALQLAGGAGGVYAASQQGGGGGALSGAMSGAMAGMVFGGVGAIVGAIVGGAIGYFGGGGDKPRAAGSIGLGGGDLTTINQGMSTEAETLWIQQRIEEFRGSVMAMNNVMRLFADGDLFSMIGEGGTFSFGGGENAVDSLAAVFRDQWLPETMRTMFEGAINTGLGGLGATDATISQLWSEVGELTGTNQITALETFIGSLVGLTNLYDDLNWNAITDASRQDSFQAFMGGMGDSIEAMQTQMLGIDSMTLLERADQATTIEQMMTQARNAEIQFLAQIDSLQQGINRSVDSQIEGLMTGGMTQGQQQQYYADQINSLMSELRGGVTSPEGIQQIMGDLQRYVGAYQGSLGDQLYATGFTGLTEADNLMAILEEARGLSNDTFDTMRDDLRTSNDSLIAINERLIAALTDVNSSLIGGGQGGPGLDVALTIDVVQNEQYMIEIIDAQFDRRWNEMQDQGPN